MTSWARSAGGGSHGGRAKKDWRTGYRRTLPAELKLWLLGGMDEFDKYGAPRGLKERAYKGWATVGITKSMFARWRLQRSQGKLGPGIPPIKRGPRATTRLSADNLGGLLIETWRQLGR
jgi:hypothetical protein